MEEVFQTQTEAEACIDGEEQAPDLIRRVYDSDSYDNSSLNA